MPTSLYTSALEYYWEFNVKKAVFGRRKNKQLVCKWYAYNTGGCTFVYTIHIYIYTRVYFSNDHDIPWNNKQNRLTTWSK